MVRPQTNRFGVVPGSVIYSCVFIIALMALLYIGSIAYRQVFSLEASESLVRQTLGVRSELEQLLSILREAENAQRGYLITKDSVYLEKYDGYDSLTYSSLNELHKLISDNPSQQLLLNQIDLLARTRLETLDQSLTFGDQNPPFPNALMTIIDKGRREMEQIRNLIQIMLENEQVLLEQRESLHITNTRLTPLIYLLVILFSFAIFTFSFFKITRDRIKIKSAHQNILLHNTIFKNAERSGSFGTYALDTKNQPLYWSDNLYRLLGLNPLKKERADNIIESSIHPEDRDLDAAIRSKIWDAKGPTSWVYRIILPDQKIKFIRESCEVTTIGKERVLVGSIQDVNSDKEAEDHLGTVIRQLLRRNTLFDHSERAAFIGNCVWISDTQKIECSPNFLHLLGLDADHTFSSTDQLIEFLHPDDQLGAIQFIQEAMRTGYVAQKILRILLPGQSEKHFRATGKYVKEGDQKILIGTFQDITSDILLNENLLTSKAKLKNTEIRYNQMISEVEDYAIFVLNKDGEIETWNKGAEKIKGYADHEIIGKSFSKFYSDEDQYRQLPCHLLNIAQETGRVTHEGWRVRKDGSKFWGSVVITAIHNDHKEVIGFTKVTRDLTAQKQQEENQRQYQLDIEDKNKTLEKINKELSSFNHVASHDLQEPLRKIQTFISRIMKEDEATLSHQGKSHFARIKVCADKMQCLIHDLITYSQMLIDKRLEPVDLNQVLQTVEQELNVELDEANGKIEKKTLPVIQGVPFQIEQLFVNIIGNSLKYRIADKDVRITINHQEIKAMHIPGFTNGLLDQKYFQISVTDNGIGFDNQYAENIFMLFKRLHGKSEYPGTGIGLAICKRIMENHHGYIHAESKPGEGATFYMYFPA